MTALFLHTKSPVYADFLVVRPFARSASLAILLMLCQNFDPITAFATLSSSSRLVKNNQLLAACRATILSPLILSIRTNFAGIRPMMWVLDGCRLGRQTSPMVRRDPRPNRAARE